MVPSDGVDGRSWGMLWEFEILQERVRLRGPFEVKESQPFQPLDHKTTGYMIIVLRPGSASLIFLYHYELIAKSIH